MELDVVVLGGGGHVGLPLSLTLADAGLRVGVYDTNQATLDRIASGEMPFLETGADELLRSVLATGRLELGHVGRDDRAHRDADRRRRHAGGRVPRPVDDGLRTGRGPGRAAPAQGRARRDAEHGLSGHHGLRPAAPRGGRLRGRRGVLPRAHRRGARARGAAQPAADHRRRRRPGGGPGDRAVPAPGREDRPDLDQGSRAGEALHQHVAVHEVRGREPVLHDRRPGRRRLHQRAAGDPRGLSARRRPAGARVRRRSVPVQGRDAARGVHDATTSRWARPRCRSTRGCPRTSSRPGAPLRRPQGQDRRDPRHGVQGRVGRHARVALVQAAQAPVVGRRRRALAPTRTSRTTASSRWTAFSRRATSSCSAPRIARIAVSTSAARTSSTCGACSAAGSGSDARPRHRRRRVHQRLPRPGAARGRPRGRRPRRLLEVRSPHEVVRRPSVLPLRRGRCQGHRAHARAGGRRRPGRRLRRDDRRDQLLPRVRLRPASPRTSASSRRRSTRPSRPTATGTSSASSWCRRRWSTSRRRSSRRPRARSSRRRRRSRPTASRSSRPSTSPRARGSSTSCRTRSSARSTASASASAVRCATPTSCPAT